ncbi:MAG: hypothetical protein LBN99_02920 [Oscillospiraceae bacterium]|jgi:hypothetical protein|nr:hypothetical protein [Oscillospiraceae bacterium]
MPTFNSNAEEIRYYLKKLMDEGGERSTKEIISYVKSKSGKDFTNGMYSGAIKDFFDTEAGYKRVRRGIYAKVEISDAEKDGADEFDLIIMRAIGETERARRMDIATLTTEEFQKMQDKSSKIVATLRSLLEQ